MHEIEAQDPNTSVVTDEMWFYTSADGSNWVETGDTSGLKVGGGSVYNTWFAAQYTPAGKFKAVYGTFLTRYDTDYPTGIHNHGGGVLYAQRSDLSPTTWHTFTGLNDSPGVAAQDGVETYSSLADVCGYQNALEYAPSGSINNVSGWAGNTAISDDIGGVYTWASRNHNANIHLNC